MGEFDFGGVASDLAVGGVGAALFGQGYVQWRIVKWGVGKAFGDD